MPRPKKDVTGKVFGRLTILQDGGHGKNPKIFCQCSCGKKITLLKHNVIRGNTSSCGCLRSESTRARRLAFRKAPKSVAPPKDFPKLYDDDEDPDCFLF
jgi:hypothetical protein